MFRADELAGCVDEEWFVQGYQALEQNLLRSRLGMELRTTDGSQHRQLSRFSQAVLASVPQWRDPRAGIERELCSKAADIEAALGVLCINHDQRKDDATSHQLRAAVLYDIAGMPGTSASQADKIAQDDMLSRYFARTADSYWGRLAATESNIGDARLIGTSRAVGDTGSETTESPAIGTKSFLAALSEILAQAGPSHQSGDPRNNEIAQTAFEALEVVASTYGGSIDCDVLLALKHSLRVRFSHSALRALESNAVLDLETLRAIGAPSELWPVQKAAIERGLLQDEVQSFGLAAPTGTGKTALARLLLADFFLRNPRKKALYLAPSRALSSQVARDLRRSLDPLGIAVASLGASLTFDPRFAGDPSEADLLVFTPEKADLLMRIDPDTVEEAGLVIVDEAHHIEQGTRGVLLEFYLWRLRSALPSAARIVQLSAVAPNIDELTSWVSPDSSRAVKLDWRTNRLRLGVFERTREGAGIVQFEREAPYEILRAGECEVDRTAGLADLAIRLATSGIVLVLTMSPGEAEKVASAIAMRRAEQKAPRGIAFTRLDARIERELYPEAPLRELIRNRVAYHHAELPPRVRVALEELIEDKQVDIVCATTTLAEGVNFPFATVLVQSLVGKSYELSPRSLWNIAGRAGRFGVDSEGHCILYRPSLWEKRLKKYKLADYTSTRLDDIPPVRSALATAIEELKERVDEGSIRLESLNAVRLNKIVADGRATASAKRVRGLINLMRVGYAHAASSGTGVGTADAAPEFADGILLAARQVSPDVRVFATELGRQQRRVLRDVLADDPELLGIAARIGWALETQSDLLAWLQSREDWQLEQFGHLVRGGRIVSFDSLGYLLGPVTKLMAELEGDTLGGFTSFIAVNWLRGLPLTRIRESQNTSFGRLVRLIYGRVQYLLPWALFGMSELLRYEAARRNLVVGAGVSDLSLLAGEGIPDFDALSLVIQLDIERVDATRLAEAHRAARTSSDVVGWFLASPWQVIETAVRGADKRRLDPDLHKVWESLRAGSGPSSSTPG